MSDVVKVKLKGTRRGFFSNPSRLEIKVGDYVLVDGEQGREIGQVLLAGELARRVRRGGGRKLRKVLKLATREEKERLAEIQRLEIEAKQVCQRKIAERRLEMNLVDAECNFEMNRLSFFFTAEKRVDFRGLIRDLAQIFKKRIKLRQIGARDKAKRMGGIGRCGNLLCCSSFLSEFEPVTLKAAKEQNLSLNPTNISGCCGRLMCCLMFERDYYRECCRRFPAVGKEVQTAQGKERVVANDIFRDRVLLRSRKGAKRTLELEEFQRERKACRVGERSEGR